MTTDKKTVKRYIIKAMSDGQKLTREGIMNRMRVMGMHTRPETVSQYMSRFLRDGIVMVDGKCCKQCGQNTPMHSPDGRSSYYYRLTKKGEERL